MLHTLVTFLGKGRENADTGYRRARYGFPERDEPVETAFFGLALAGHLEPDRTVILGTRGSQWSVLVEHLTRDGGGAEATRMELLDAEIAAAVSQPLLDRVEPLLSDVVGMPITPRLIAFGADADEQYAILDAIADAVPDGDVSFDLTHGFRHLGMVGFLSAFMLERLRNLRVRGLWYGALDMTDRESGVTPVLRLDGLSRVRRWLDALDRFDATGDYGVFKPLLIDDRVPTDKARCLALAAFHERTLNVPDAARQLRTFLPVLDAPLPGASGLFQARLQERLRWVREAGLAQHQRRLAFEHLKRRDFLRAATFGWEALITRECDRRGLPADNYGAGREPAVKALAGEIDAGEHPDSTRDAFRLLRDVRNTLVHGNPPRRRKSRSALRDPERLHDALEKAFQRLLP